MLSSPECWRSGPKIGVPHTLVALGVDDRQF